MVRGKEQGGAQPTGCSICPVVPVLVGRGNSKTIFGRSVKPVLPEDVRLLHEWTEVQTVVIRIDSTARQERCPNDCERTHTVDLCQPVVICSKGRNTVGVVHALLPEIDSDTGIGDTSLCMG